MGHSDLGGAGLAGEGHLADMAFTLADSISPTTPIDIYLDVVSLGPSFNERDDIRPQVAFLRNYCDAEGQALPEGIFFRSAGQNHSFSATGTGDLADGSAGEVLVSARLLQAGSLRAGHSLYLGYYQPRSRPSVRVSQRRGHRHPGWCDPAGDDYQRRARPDLSPARRRTGYHTHFQHLRRRLVR